MKKILLLLLLIFAFSGCQNIKNINYDGIVEEILKNDVKLINVRRVGYKYYLPPFVKVDFVNDYNEVLSTNSTKYYLYIDLISYYNKAKNEYKKNDDSYFSYVFNKNDNEGLLKINKKNDDFMVELAYNYAKIELITNEHNLKSDILKAITILSSIKYNEKVINAIIGENPLNFSEEIYSITKEQVDENDSFLEYNEEYDVYDSSDDEIPDYDVIN